MRSGNLNREKLLETIREETGKSSNGIQMLMEMFPQLSEVQCKEITNIISDAIDTQNRDKVSLVVTAPSSIDVKSRATMNVVQTMISGAKRNILITGYSLSSYCSDLFEIIVEKSMQGVVVKFFVNDIAQPEVDKILPFKGRFLQIYKYLPPLIDGEKDEMASLHAKVISVDDSQTLITSANLSYHGQRGNIELGVLIDSKRIAKKIDEIFIELSTPSHGVFSAV